VSIQFIVYGTPKPQGSTRAFIPKGWKRAVITTDNVQLKPWRQQISLEAIALQQPLREGPIRMGLRFFFKRPKSAPKSRIHPTVKPDTDKLIRAILDALTGILYRDDAQVVQFSEISKAYGDPERVEIQLEEL